MFTIHKFVKPFLWPPGLFVLLLLGLGIWQAFRGRGRAALVAFGFAAPMWLMATMPAADILLRPLETRYERPTRFDGDVIIMLGSAVYDGAPDLDGVGAPGAEACERLLATARLYRLTGLPIILTGGGVHPHQSAIMGPVYQRFLVALGIPPERILLERQSRNTFENASAAWVICQRRGFQQPLVVTHAAHMPRAMFCFETLNIAARPVPCGFRTWKGKSYHWLDILPRSFTGVATALHEYFGLWFYRWQYRSAKPS